MPENSPLTADRRALAQWLEQDRRGIVTEWMKAVQDDAQIPNADRLTFAALQDHFPDLLAELIEAFREPTTVGDAETQETAQDHGRARWRNGYRLDEVLRELSRVREIIMARIKTYCDEHALGSLRDEAERTVRRFFDTIAVSSARQFMQEQHTEVILRSRQLQNAYEQVQAATDELRDVAESRLRLLRGVIHELRNALQAVEFGAASLAQEAASENRNTVYSQLSGNAVHLQRVLGRLREFSSILAGEARLQLEQFGVSTFLRSLEKPHREAAQRKGLHYEATVAPGLATVTIDIEKLRHIADILLSNAIDHTEQGSIKVTTAPDGPDRWIFSVEDTGAGIDEADARHVFHEFHRSPRAALRGVGLGLVIARHLAHLIDAEITFRSQAGAGTRFEVNLPIDLSTGSPPSAA